MDKAKEDWDEGVMFIEVINGIGSISLGKLYTLQRTTHIGKLTPS